MKINKPISIIIIFIIILTLIFLFVKPKYEDLSQSQNTLALKQLEYDSKFAYYAKISEIIKSIEEKKDATGKIDSALPNTFYLSSLIYFIKQKTAESGMTMDTITLSKVSLPSEDSAIRDVIFNIHVAGSYESFKNFLSSLDKSARLFDVNSISFAAPATGNNPNLPAASLYRFTMELTTHTY